MFDIHLLFARICYALVFKSSHGLEISWIYINNQYLSYIIIYRYLILFHDVKSIL